MIKPDLSMLVLKESSSRNGVFYFSESEAFSEFENNYLKVRKEENRLYPDSIVRKLPYVDHSNQHFVEWQLRIQSFDRLITFLSGRNVPAAVLDLGCGNGWMANQISQHLSCKVIAMDINRAELEQGSRVFSKRRNLYFIYGDVFDNIFKPSSFDHIILGSSIQYFRDLKSLLKLLLNLVRTDGMIHIIDSPLYSSKSMDAAKQRTLNYFQEMGFSKFGAYYNHHQWKDLNGFRFKIKYTPNSLYNRFRKTILKRIISPFPWIIVYRS